MLRSIFALPAFALLIVVTGCDSAPTTPRAFLPDRDASNQPRSAPELVYPVPMLVQRREGVETVECMVLTTGATQNCKVIAGSEEPEFRQSALDYAAHSIYAPAIRNGVAVESNKRWTFVFGFVPDAVGAKGASKDTALPAGAVPPRTVAGTQAIYPARMQQFGREGIAEVECTITVAGTSKDCRVTNGAGGVLFYYAALNYAQRTHFAPALLNGAPIEVRHHWVTSFRLSPTGPVAPTLPLDKQPINVTVSSVPINYTARWPEDSTTRPTHGGTAEFSCVITAASIAKDCAITQSSGDATGDQAVLALVSPLRFYPALREGTPVEERGTWKIAFTTDTGTIFNVKAEDMP